jgi:hypothetical protein
MQLVQGPSASTAADAFYTIGLNVDNCYRMYVESGNLIVQSKIGGVKGTVLTIAYNATSHAFWRIRHDAGRDRCLRGGAGKRWRARHLGVTDLDCVEHFCDSLASVNFELKGGTWRTEVNNPGTVFSITSRPPGHNPDLDPRSN